MQCIVCNSSEFDLHDGVYSCRECQSQIEASRKEQAEQEGGFSKKSLLKSAPKEKSKDQKKTNLYIPWTTTDGFNLILYKQVSALIKLGASEKLKNVVLFIWSKYLRKCEYAFRTDYNSKENLPRLSAYAKKRDIEVLYRDKHLSKSQMKKQAKRNLLKGKKIDNADTETSEELTSDANESSDLQGIYSENESDGTSADSSGSQERRKINLSSHVLKLHKTLGKKRVRKSAGIRQSCVYHMTISRTLSFCYLGLLYTEDQLLLWDLLRLVKEGKIPYIDVTNSFPPSMPLQYSDITNFRTKTIPTLGEVSQMSAKLFKFLDLPSFKHRPPMPMVFRFVKDLNLPDSIIPIANLLYNKMKRKNTVWYKTQYHNGSQICHIPLYEVEAMAFIIMSLKLLLVLDGKFEVEHSKVMKKINVLLKGQKVFDWEEWKRQMMLKKFLFMKNGCSFSDFSHLDSLSADEIIRKYPIARLKEVDEYSRKKSCKFSFARKEIKTLLENITNQEDTFAFNKTSSFPLKDELSRFVAESDTWHMFKETKERDLTFLNKDFSSDLLFYKRTKEISEESEELIYLLLSTLYESSEILTLCDLLSNCQHMLKTTSKYWYKYIPRSELEDCRELWIAKLPVSFAWLLKLVCNYMQVSCKYLYMEVIAIEELILHLK